MSAMPRDPGNSTFYKIEEDPNRVALLKAGLRQGWQLALHGYDHQRTADRDGTEFEGLPEATQQLKIEKGAEILRSCFPEASVKVFVPPWNSFDKTTVTCLEKQGFEFLCGGDAPLPGWTSAVQFVPSIFAAADLMAYASKHSARELSTLLETRTVVVTLHH